MPGRSCSVYRDLVKTRRRGHSLGKHTMRTSPGPPEGCLACRVLTVRPIAHAPLCPLHQQAAEKGDGNLSGGWGKGAGSSVRGTAAGDAVNLAKHPALVRGRLLTCGCQGHHLVQCCVLFICMLSTHVKSVLRISCSISLGIPENFSFRPEVLAASLATAPPSARKCNYFCFPGKFIPCVNVTLHIYPLLILFQFCL